MTEFMLRSARVQRSSRELPGQLLAYVAIAALLAVTLFPVYWLVLTSLKQQRDFFTDPPIFATADLTLAHYRAVIEEPLNRSYMLNSMQVAVISTLAATAIGVLAAYALARVRLPLRLNRVLLISILISRLFPPVSLALPYYLIMRKLGLLDTVTALAITNTALAIPFVVWIMLTFFQDLPREIERAAMVDGCTPWQRFVHVVLPLSVTSIAVTAVFVFIGAWNELLYALTITSLQARTIPVAIAGFVGDNALAWGQMSAFSVLSILPVLAMAFAVQRYLVRGLTFGAVKG